jgi:hypothetical protein
MSRPRRLTRPRPRPSGSASAPNASQKWTTDKDRLIYVRLNTGKVFQVTLAHDCPGLGMYQTIAFDTDFGSEICEGQHATIITRSGAGPLHCPVGVDKGPDIRGSRRPARQAQRP